MATERDWPWDRLSEKEKLMFALVKTYMDYYGLWADPTQAIDEVIRKIVAMSDEEKRAFVQMVMVDGLVN